MERDGVYLRHILDASTKIEMYLGGLTQEAFLQNDLVLDAVVRELEIIGEALKEFGEGAAA